MSKSDRLKQIKQRFEEIHANPPKTFEEVLEEYSFPSFDLDEDADFEP